MSVREILLVWKIHSLIIEYLPAETSKTGRRFSLRRTLGKPGAVFLIRLPQFKTKAYSDGTL